MIFVPLTKEQSRILKANLARDKRTLQGKVFQAVKRADASRNTLGSIARITMR